MVGCDNHNCPYQGFHLSCLKLPKPPKGKIWYCPDCHKLDTKEQEEYKVMYIYIRGQNCKTSNITVEHLTLIRRHYRFAHIKTTANSHNLSSVVIPLPGLQWRKTTDW